MARMPDLGKMGLAELKGLARDIEKAIAKVEREELKKAREAAEAAVNKFGFSLSDVTGGSRKSGASKSKTPPKYRNPENPVQTWSGRGRQPDWYKSALEKGKSPEDMAV